MWLALTSFEVAVVAYGEAIASLETVMCHIRLPLDVGRGAASVHVSVKPNMAHHGF